MTKGAREAPAIRDVEELLNEVQNEPIRRRLDEEQTLEQVIKAFDGDEDYLADAAKELMAEDERKNRDDDRQRDRRDARGRGARGRLLVTEFARLLVDEARGRVDYSLDDAVDMLTRYAAVEDRKGGRAKATEVDPDAFRAQFAKLRDKRGIKFGRYKRDQSRGRDKGGAGGKDDKYKGGKPPARGPATKSHAKFVMPDEPRGNIDATMAGIGRLLIRSRRNYEEVFLREIGSGASAARPLIDFEAVWRAFQEMDV